MKLIVLDRDGVINEDREDYVKNAEEWVPIAGSLEAIARLSRQGWTVLIATNQSGIGRGLFSMDDFLAMQQKMNEQLAMLGGRVDAVFFCPHLPEEGCHCRKPSPGMLHDIIERYEVDPAQVYMVGDSLRDIQAALAGGFKPWLVRTGNGLKTLEKAEFPKETPVSDNLQSVVDILLAEDN